MPPTLDMKARPIEPRFPNVERIAMIMPGDTIEEGAVGVPHAAQARAIKPAAYRKGRQKIIVGHAKNERRAWFEHPSDLDQRIIEMGNMFQDRVAHRAGEVTIREGQRRAIGLRQAEISPSPARLTQRPPPGINSHLQRTLEGDRGKMPIAAAYIQGRGRQGNIHIETRFDSSQQGAEVWQVA